MNDQKRIFKKQEMHEIYAAQLIYEAGNGFRAGLTLADSTPPGPLAKVLQEQGLKSVEITHCRVVQGGWIVDLQEYAKLSKAQADWRRDESPEKMPEQKIDWEKRALARVEGEGADSQEGLDVWIVEMAFIKEGKIARVAYLYHGAFLPCRY